MTMPCRYMYKVDCLLHVDNFKIVLSLQKHREGANNWGIFQILAIATGEGIGPAGEISPVVCMLKNGLFQVQVKGVILYRCQCIFIYFSNGL